MNINTLKELLKLYSQLPCGVMIFKNDELYFLNDHLRNILTLGSISVGDSLDIISSMMGVSSSSKELFDFFSKKPFFSYKEKQIQISHKKHEEYEIFVFIKLDSSALDEIFKNYKEATKITAKEIEDSTPEPEEDNQDSKILEYFDKNHNVKTTGIVLYKGIPLISENIVLKIYENLLVVKIEDKQMICSNIGTNWIIKTDEGMTFQATIKGTNRAKKFIFLSNPKIIEKGFNKRQYIRYELSKPLPLEIYLGKRKATLEIVDISEKSLKALTDDANVLDSLSTKKNTFEATIKLRDKTINLSCKFLREGQRYNQKAEVIFLFTLEHNSKVVLNKWLNKQQIKAIREIRSLKETLH